MVIGAAAWAAARAAAAARDGAPMQLSPQVAETDDRWRLVEAADMLGRLGTPDDGILVKAVTKNEKLFETCTLPALTHTTLTYNNFNRNIHLPVKFL